MAIIQRRMVCLVAFLCAAQVEAQVEAQVAPLDGRGVNLTVARAWQPPYDPQSGQQKTAPVDPLPPGGFANLSAGSDTTLRLVVGQGRILTTSAPIVKQGGAAVIAVGDPTVADFEVLPNPRMLRLIGKRPGATDLTFVTSDEKTFVYKLQVQQDLSLLEARLRQSFPGALVHIVQLGPHLVIEGQARDQRQLVLIESTVRAYIASLQATADGRGLQSGQPGEMLYPEAINGAPPGELPLAGGLLQALPEGTPRSQGGTTALPQIINLMTLPGVQQIMLQVRVAELNRTGMRKMGADTFFEWGPGNILGTAIGGGTSSLQGLNLGPRTTGFGIFPTARMEIMFAALRDNSLARILAEPNLVALSGHEASFLAGGQFPVPVPQGGAIANNVTVQFKDFGVQLNFVPHVLDDDMIRLEVRPEVSTIDERLGTTLVAGGTPVPGLNTRRVHTTVQLRQGESLALAGLLQVTLDAGTTRIPGLGDLPYLGPFFSNTSHERVEKELLVLVTPYFVSPLDSHHIPPLPGEEIKDPNDLEFYLLNRIEGRTGREFRSTTTWDDPLHLVRLLKLQRDYVCGPFGFAPHPSQIRVPQSSPIPPPMPPQFPTPAPMPPQLPAPVPMAPQLPTPAHMAPQLPTPAPMPPQFPIPSPLPPQFPTPAPEFGQTPKRLPPP